MKTISPALYSSNEVLYLDCRFNYTSKNIHPDISKHLNEISFATVFAYIYMLFLGVTAVRGYVFSP